MGCLARLAALAALAALVYIAWAEGPALWNRFAGTVAAPSLEEPSPELASEAVGRYERLAAGESDRADFSATEIESVLRYSVSGWLPDGLAEPSVRIADGEVRLGFRVALEALPSVPELDRIRGILPDTVPAELRGALLTLDGGEAVLVVRRVDLASIPLPRTLFPAVIEAIDPGDRTGLPAEAVRIPVPPEIRSIYIDGDRLFLKSAS